MDIQKKLNNKVRLILVLAGVVVLSLFVIFPLVHQGFFPMHDDTQIGRIGEMTKALRDGEFPVRWVKDLGYGYGYPIFNFYAPLPFYLGSVFQLIGFNVLNATKITFGLALLASAITMFIFAREFFGGLAAVVAAMIYVYFPYHAVDTYVRGNLDELLAYAFLPLVFLAFYKLYYYAKGIQLSFPIRWVLLLAISASLVTLSHNLSAFMLVIIMLPLFIVSLFFVPRRVQYISWFVVAAVLSIALSAFYVIPALSEMHMTNVLSQVGGGSYYPDHFVCPSQLWNSPWGYGGSVKGCIDGMSFKLGKDNVLFVILAILIFLVAWLLREYSDFFLKASLIVLLLFSLFLVLPWSLSIWNSVPFMEFLQFPWRFLSFTGFFLSATVAMGIYTGQRVFRLQKALMVVLAAFIVAGTLWYNARLFVPEKYEVHAASYYSSPSYLEWYVSKQSSEYLPKNFRKVSSAHDIVTQQALVTSGNAQLQSIRQTTTTLDTKINAYQPSTVHLNLAHYPNWHYFLDTQSVPVTVQNNGVSIAIPTGSHMVSAVYSQTSIEKVANLISVIGLLTVLILIFRVQYKR